MMKPPTYMRTYAFISRVIGPEAPYLLAFQGIGLAMKACARVRKTVSRERIPRRATWIVILCHAGQEYTVAPRVCC